MRNLQHWRTRGDRSGRSVKSLVLFGSLLIVALVPGGAFPGTKPPARPKAPAQAKAPAQPASNWPSFRGLDAGGVVETAATPTTWNIEEGKNIRWKTPIPGQGHSSPVIWGNRLWVTSAVRSAGDAP